MNDLLEIAAVACETAISTGAEFADAVAVRGADTSVEMEKDSINSVETRRHSNVSVRAFVRGGLGWAGSDGLDADAAVAAGRNAAELARAAEPDPDFVSLPGPADYPNVDGLSDSAIADIDVRRPVEWMLAGLESAKSVSSEAIVQGAAAVGAGEEALVNSLGVRVAQRSTSVGMHVFCVIRHGDDVGSFYEFDTARMLLDFDPEGIGAKATEGALKFLGARTIATGATTIVLGPRAGRALLCAIVGNLDAEGIQRGRSFMINKKGEPIASEVITIHDDPLIHRGMSSRPCDGEGFPSRKLAVIENGVLLTYLHNSYTAAKAREPNTGHSTRGGIAPTNLVPKLGTKTSAELISEVEDGLYIDAGSLFPNSTTGEVSANVDFGFKIEQGRIACPVRNTMVGVSFLEMLGKIDAVSSDYREEPGMIMPTIRIRDIGVAGGK